MRFIKNAFILFFAGRSVAGEIELSTVNRSNIGLDSLSGGHDSEKYLNSKIENLSQKNDFHTIETLKEAICDNDIELVSAILAEREKNEANGLHVLDLNTGYFRDGTGNALLFALSRERNPACNTRLPVDGEMIELILSTHDKTGNIAVDINYLYKFGSKEFLAVLHELVHPFSPYTGGSREKILRQILNLRKPNGLPALDLELAALKPDSFLWEVVMLNDLIFLQSILDLRISNVNKIMDHHTVLDFALSKEAIIYKYDERIVNAIRKAGGLTSSEIKSNILKSKSEYQIEWFRNVYPRSAKLIDDYSSLELVAEVAWWSEKLGLSNLFEKMSYDEIRCFNPLAEMFDKESETERSFLLNSVCGKLKKPGGQNAIFALKQAVWAVYMEKESLEVQAKNAKKTYSCSPKLGF